MDAAVMADVWFVFSMCCLAAALLGSVRWLLLTRSPQTADSAVAVSERAGAAADRPGAVAYGCRDADCFACAVDGRII